jgi:hypothetical protein
LGIVYVLRSKSDHPTVVSHQNVLHKIGVTGGDVARRLADPSPDADRQIKCKLLQLVAVVDVSILGTDASGEEQVARFRQRTEIAASQSAAWRTAATWPSSATAVSMREPIGPRTAWLRWLYARKSCSKALGLAELRPHVARHNGEAEAAVQVSEECLPIG